MSLFFQNIDELPIYNWNKVHETGDLRFILLKNTSKPFTKKQLLTATQKWTVIYEEYIAKFGFSEHFIDMLEIEKEIALLIIEKNETGDMSFQTGINLLNAKIERKIEEMPKGDFFLLKAQMEKQLGFRINTRECSVMEFYSYLKSLQKN